MQTYISILRGINVGGHNKVDMAGLKTMYQELGFKEIISYIQSGNIIFQSDPHLPPNDLAKVIKEAILSKFKLTVPVIIRSIDEMQKVIEKNPFLKMADIDAEKLHVTFLAEEPVSEKVQLIAEADYSPDRFIIVDREVFLNCPSGYGNTKLNNTFFESKLKTAATTRNWKTVNKLFELATSIA